MQNASRVVKRLLHNFSIFLDSLRFLAVYRGTAGEGDMALAPKPKRNPGCLGIVIVLVAAGFILAAPALTVL